jgi:RNA polymerase sigma-70 factor (ECF subfamily)
LEDVLVTDSVDLDRIPDKRLELLFVCTHPAVEPGIRTPLMLQTVLGVEAAEIARAFAVPVPAMAQRLVRAKRRIKMTGIPFAVPGIQDMPARLPAVLEAVYGAYAIDWQVEGDLSAESLYLALLLARLLPDPEVLGLASLLSLSLSRADARLVDGRHVPLDSQDVTRWNPRLIAQGEELLRRASLSNAPGRFQLEAAIQSVHCARASSGVTDWTALLKLHRALVRESPTLGAQVALASVLAHSSPRDGLTLLDELGSPDFQPYWATRAHLLAAVGRADAAAHAYAKAIALTTDPAVREWLAGRADAPV